MQSESIFPLYKSIIAIYSHIDCSPQEEAFAVDKNGYTIIVNNRRRIVAACSIHRVFTAINSPLRSDLKTKKASTSKGISANMPN